MSQRNSDTIDVPRLTKNLYAQITRLKLLDRPDAEVRFRLQRSPFSGDEDEEEIIDKKRDDCLIIGQIFPKSEIYRDRSYSIQITLTKTYPADPPEVRFLTPMYHPNVGKEDGRLCGESLQKNVKWTMHKSLVEVIKAVVRHIDKPNIDCAMSYALGREYINNPAEFKKNALEYVEKYGLPR